VTACTKWPEQYLDAEIRRVSRQWWALLRWYTPASAVDTYTHTPLELLGPYDTEESCRHEAEQHLLMWRDFSNDNARVRI
jgi:hypothetical protein